MKTISLRFAVLLLFTNAAAACPQSVEARLRSAGYTDSQMDRLCPATTALVERGVLLHTHATFVDELARAVFPIVVELPGTGDVARLTDGIYCGAGENEHRGEFVAIARSSLSMQLRSTRLTAADCQDALENVAKRLAAGGEEGSWAIAARLRMEWKPWVLSVYVLRVDGRTPAGTLPERWDAMRAALVSGRSVQQTSLDNIEAARATDSTRVIRLAGVVYFDSSSIAIAAALPEDLTSVTTAADVPRLSAFGSPMRGNSGNVTIRMSYTAINTFATRLMAFGEIPIQLVPPVASGLLRTLQVQGGTDRFTASGTGVVMLFGNEMPLFGTMELDGKPLAIRKVGVTAADEEYRWLTDLLAQGLTDKFQGRPWNPFGQDQVVPFPWGGSLLELKGQILDVGATEDALVLQNQFSLQKVSR